MSLQFASSAWMRPLIPAGELFALAGEVFRGAVELVPGARLDVSGQGWVSCS